MSPGYPSTRLPSIWALVEIRSTDGLTVVCRRTNSGGYGIQVSEVDEWVRADKARDD